MQDVIIAVPFDYQRFMDGQKYIWTYTNKKFIKSQITFGILGSIFLIISLTFNDKNNFSFLTVMSSGYLFYILLGTTGYFERRAKFLKRAKEFAARNEQGSLTCTFTFSDYGIEYQDKEKQYKFSWPLFYPYITFKDNIILILKDTKSVTFTFKKGELNDEKYTELCTILNDKLGKDAFI